MRTMLIYVATGKAGRLVMARARAGLDRAGDAERTWERKALFFNY